MMEKGNGESRQAELPDERKIAIQNGMLALHAIEQERDTCRAALQEARVRLAELQAEHDALKLAYARQQTEMDTYRRDRDEAVTAKAKVEAVFDAVATIMQKHRRGTLSDTPAIPRAKPELPY